MLHMVSRRIVVVPVCLLLLSAGVRLRSQERRESAEISADRVLAMTSLVGAETPFWSPDGAWITFSSSLGGGGLWAVHPDGGFPRRMVENIGGAGFFLSRQSPVWSPDGNFISYISDKSGTSELWLWSKANGRRRQLTGMGGRINGYSWSPDSGSIVFSGDRYGNYDIWKVSVVSGDIERLTRDTRYEVYPTWTPDGGSVVYVRLDERWRDHQVLRISHTGGTSELIFKDEDFFDYSAGGAFGFPAVSPSGKTILFRSQRSGWINYFTIPLDGGEARPVASEDADQSEGLWSPDGSQIAFLSNYNGTHKLRVVDFNPAGSEKPPRTLVDPGIGVVARPQWSPDGKRLSYTLQTPTRAQDLYVVDAATGQSNQLTYSMIAGDFEEQLIAPEKITYKSEQFTIHSYLYRPPNSDSRVPFPGIILVHGGPTSQFNDTFQRQADFFAHQGYVVLLPNVRGSSGYGRKFEMANNGDWGHGDLRDVVAGADYLKSLPYVDPEHLGIMGTSYGGHLSAAAITWAPEVFQAAIPASGYPNRIAFMEEGEFRHLQQLAYEFGPFEHNRDVYYRNSPFFWIRQIQTPTFLLNGEGRFPGSTQMRDFAAEMERHYKVFRYEAYPNENYYVRSPANTRQMLLDMLEFFEQYLRNR